MESRDDAEGRFAVAPQKDQANAHWPVATSWLKAVNYKIAGFSAFTGPTTKDLLAA
jgi:hypothetical protein